MLDAYKMALPKNNLEFPIIINCFNQIDWQILIKEASQRTFIFFRAKFTFFDALLFLLIFLSNAFFNNNFKDFDRDDCFFYFTLKQNFIFTFCKQCLTWMLFIFLSICSMSSLSEIISDLREKIQLISLKKKTHSKFNRMYW